MCYYWCCVNACVCVYALGDCLKHIAVVESGHFSRRCWQYPLEQFCQTALSRQSPLVVWYSNITRCSCVICLSVCLSVRVHVCTCVCACVCMLPIHPRSWLQTVMLSNPLKTWSDHVVFWTSLLQLPVWELAQLAVYSHCELYMSSVIVDTDWRGSVWCVLCVCWGSTHLLPRTVVMEWQTVSLPWVLIY